MKCEKIVYDINDLRELYNEYVFPTIKSNYKPNSYIIRQVKKLCVFAEITYDELEKDLHLNLENFKKLKVLLENRKMYSENQLMLYSANQLCEIFNCCNSHISKLHKRKVINFATSINGVNYYYPDEVDIIKKILVQTHSIEYIYAEVRKTLNGINISDNTIRDYMKKNHLAIINPVDKYDLRLNKENLYFLINNIDRNFKNKNIKEIDDLSVEFEQNLKEGTLNYISQNVEEYYDYFYLKDFFISPGVIKSKSLKINKEVIKKIIRNCNEVGVFWFTNKELNNIYIQKDDYTEFQSKLYEISEINKEEFYTTNEVCELLEVSSYTTILQYAGYKKKDGHLLIFKNKVDELYKLKTETIAINIFAAEIGVLERRVKKAAENLNIEILRFSNIPLFRADRIDIKDTLKVKKVFEKERRIKEARNDYDRFYITVEDSFKNELIPETYKVFEKFLFHRFKKNKGKIVFRALVFCYENIVLNFKKEILECTDNDIVNILNHDYNHQEAVRQFLFFLEFCQVNYTVKYINDYNFKTTNYETAEQYSMKIWNEFRTLMFDCNTVKYAELLTRAIDSKMGASVWLFCAIHYVCAWRANDIIQQLPKINLEITIGLNELETIEAIKENRFNEGMAQRAVNEVIKHVKYLEPKSSKNESKLLSLTISNSYIYTIGLLMCLCEAHRRLAEKSNKRLNTKFLITENALRKDNHIKFFGERYSEIFNEEHFSNNRANKTYLATIQLVSQKEGWGDGYYLASLQRGHSVNKRGIPDTTQIYLQHINKDEDVDKIMYALTERGSFGYILHQLMKIITVDGGEYNELDMIEQNKQINELISLKPSEVEQVVKGFTEYRTTIENSIQELINQNKIDVKSILIKLTLGAVPSKMNYSQCLLKTTGKEQCIYPLRSECVGCQYLVPEMYFLVEFNNKLFNLINDIESCEHDFDKERYSFMLTNKYLPILEDSILCFGKERVEAFINLSNLRDRMVDLNRVSKLLVR